MRKLASIKRIDKVEPIPGADAIEVAVVGGWKVVVKKGEYTPGQHAIYLEVDSWVPKTIAPFLCKGDKPKFYEGVEGERLKTVRLRGQISQGLLLPISVSDKISDEYQAGRLVKGDVVTELLGIKKWEPEIPAQLAGEAKGLFPSAIQKTDQERCQNLQAEIQNWIEEGLTWEVTEKLDGSSCTFYLTEEEGFEVCSRNLNLRETEGNTFWRVAREMNIENAMRGKMLYGYAIQGELIGPGIQGNKYNLKHHTFRVFDIQFNGEYLSPEERTKVCELLQLPHCPVIETAAKIGTVEELLKMAEGKSLLNPKQEREGLVFKANEKRVSFKAISNKFLLKGGE